MSIANLLSDNEKPWLNLEVNSINLNSINLSVTSTTIDYPNSQTANTTGNIGIVKIENFDALSSNGIADVTISNPNITINSAIFITPWFTNEQGVRYWGNVFNVSSGSFTIRFRNLDANVGGQQFIQVAFLILNNT